MGRIEEEFWVVQLWAVAAPVDEPGIRSTLGGPDLE